MTSGTNKIYIVLVLCVAGVISTWLISRAGAKTESPPENAVIVENYRDPSLNSAIDWQKILTGVATVYSNTTGEMSSSLEDTTITAQLAKDFFSQYLSFKQGGHTITASDVNQITDNTLSLPTYTKVSGAVYLSSNLRISSNTDTDSFKRYRDAINISLKNNIGNTTKDLPMNILNQALGTKNEKTLEKLNPIILGGKNLLKDLISMETPNQAVTLHLAVLNASSNVLADLEAMHQVFIDPVRGLAGASQYAADIAGFQTALTNLNMFLVEKIR